MYYYCYCFLCEVQLRTRLFARFAEHVRYRTTLILSYEFKPACLHPYRSFHFSLTTLISGKKMSQKTTRRARRPTNDEDPTSFKAPTPKPNGTEESPPIEEEKEATPPPQPEDKPTEKASPAEVPKETTTAEPPEETTTAELPKETEVSGNDVGIVTRSRSATPQVKKLLNGHEEEQNEEPKEEIKEDLSVPEVKPTEEVMDPLIVSDEPDPELVFEENSDLESGRESPVLSRCKTRRSQTRNIPTPKTPKSMMEEEAPIPEEEQGEELNVTFESCSENVSTKAEAGGDSTRLDYMEREVSNLETNSFLQTAKNKSLGETLRRLSTRRTIRPISEDYRKRLHQNNLGRKNVSATYPSRNSVERISSVGLKRKNSEETDSFGKRFKSESPGFFSKFASPLASIRNTWRTDLPSSTPKLTGYKDEKFLLEEENSKMFEVQDGERRWCSIM